VEGGPSKDILNDSLYFLDLRINENIVVHCKGGRSRSVAIVLAWLVKHKGISTGIETVKSMRKEASPNMEVVRIADKLFDLHGVLVQSVLEDPVFQKNSVMVKEKRRRHLLLKN
jgi:predicted protein tyrosine phosphatase